VRDRLAAGSQLRWPAGPSLGRPQSFLTGESPMKSFVIAALAATSLLVGGVAHASADKATSAGCMKCHDVEKKKMGASFKDIAGKNKANKDYADAATKKITSGSGHPKSAASEADVKEIMVWVMTL
jgi:cytochrome c